MTSLVLSATPALAGGKKARPKRVPKKGAKAPKEEPAPTPEGSPAEGTPQDGATPPAASLGDPATAPPSPAPQSPAQPAGPAPGTPEAKAKAKALQKEATKLYNVQQYEKAAELYQEAYLLDSNPAYLYASAQSQRLGGDCTKALQSYQAYLRANPPESERAKAQANIERCEQELREREAAVSAERMNTLYEVPTPPPPPPEEEKVIVVPPPPEKSNIVGHVMLGLGVVSIGAGSYLFYTGRSDLDKHNSAATYDDYVGGLSDVDSAKKKQQLGLIVAGAGLGLVGGAILYYVIRSGGDEETPPPVQANVSPGSATVSFTGKF